MWRLQPKSLRGWAGLLMALSLISINTVQAENPDYQKAQWHPIHFQPQIANATNEQCLSCHQEILKDKPLEQSPAGVKATDVLAWYQTLDTYQGDQDTMHRRHLVGPLATRLMDMKCSTCHQGSNPREAAPIPPVQTGATFTLRKKVDPNTCLMCHGNFNYKVMTGLPDHWSKSGELFGNNCLACHAAFRTNRHKVNFLKPEAIEAAGKESGDFCYGCHGGRQWYRINYPYPRHPWPGMTPETPEWAKGRPTESEARFLQYMKTPGQPASGTPQ
ncbi:MAG: hypothetical protein WAU60_16125 [Candidatus Competibacter denitrificans]|jgi:hypothetical protein